MLVGVVSDIHCNIAALDAAIDAMGDRVDEVLCAGDAVYEYRLSNEVVERVREIGAPYVLGNHELVLLSPAGAPARARPDVRTSNLEYLATVPTRLELTIGGRRLLMVHGSPWAPYNDYLYESSARWAQCEQEDLADILVVGHTHVPMAARKGRTLVVNPGSVSEPRGPDPDRRGSYAIIDTDAGDAWIEYLG
ncbi:MAG TPA: metallophosphoesterase family protein [Acidimicrobiales bacterium]|nr:metallophosphoesterase family protein [Acidimicrobiales bacterium]